jgi:Domain of unknown function (DUF4397)
MYKIKRQVSHDIIIPCVDDRNSFTRFFHSVPDMPPIDVYVDGIMRVKNIPYLGLSFYVSSVAGTHTVQYYESGTKNLLLDIPEHQSPGGNIITFTLDRVGENLNLLMIVDDISQKVYPDETKVRFVNLTGEEITIAMTYLSEETPLITERVKPAIPSEYVRTRAGLYSIKAVTNKPGAYNPTARIGLPIGKLTSIYIVGSLDPTLKLFKEGGSAQFVIIVDGNTMFSKCW